MFCTRSRSKGLLKSATAGESWQRMAGVEASDLQFISVSRSTILVSGLRYAQISVDAGKSWAPVSMPPQLTQIGAAAVDEFGAVWMGGREGVFISGNKGASWDTLKDLFLRDVNSIYYDEASQRMLLTANGTGTLGAGGASAGSILIKVVGDGVEPAVYSSCWGPYDLGDFV